MRKPLTSRGTATKHRIVEAAARLIYAKGAERVSLDEVMEASSTSKSQLYHYFDGKDALVRDVIAFNTSRILETSSPHLERLESLEGLRAWCDMVIVANRASGSIGGCPLGSLANELATRTEETRQQLDRSFAAWGMAIEAGLRRMKDNGRLKACADTGEMTTAILAAIQGGILLSKTARDARPLELALDMACSHVERHAV